MYVRGSTGEAPLWTNWKTGAPSQESYQCVSMEKNAGYQWNDKPCHYKRHFVCVQENGTAGKTDMPCYE